MKIKTAGKFDICLTALAPAIWGTTYIVATELLPPNHPLLVAALRSLPIGILLTASLQQLPKGIWWWRIFLLGGLNIGIFQALLFVAAYRLPGGVAATAGAIQPLLVVIFSWLLLGDKPSKCSIIAAITGFIGVGLLVLSPAARLDWIGIGAAIAGAVTMGLGTTLTKRWKRPVSLLVFTAWQLAIGGMILLPIALVVEKPLTNLSVTNLLGFVYLGLVGTGLAYMLWFRGIERLKATAVSSLGLMSPLVATLMGFLVLHQTLMPIQLIGAAIVLVSVLVGQQTNRLGDRSTTHKISSKKLL
ncbi:EamA family transporter [Nostoc sp. UCD121]|uniref:EamA family transporter n=1 Tax=unclassified Nostoc TaxID=2593658 RepID=UPI0016266240|nr:MULTISPECIES: EamA family transporter [unclassified Nostoc]MBC1223775.1 EamA family transporter [Nostoc sp. UCD120]MBC1276549.1 EamA family transporter [Nostoc sp. UCD121]MBC1296036.1 EamA family transporter [Nostoc sp. UCD122]